jgi:RHS repeat-associated protein
MKYFHTDHIGSVQVVTDQAGTVVERLSYDVFGKRRNTNGLDDAGNITLGNQIKGQAPHRGYTGHEMLEETALVHMNGRIYDPALGRVLSADPIIQAPFNSQSYNRYSYVMNNPLALTDPSGYNWITSALRGAIFGIFSLVPSIGDRIDHYFANNKLGQFLLNVGLSYIGPGGAALSSAYLTAVQGGSDSDIFMAGLKSGVTAYAFYLAGGVGDADSAARYAAHAGAGCLSGYASGDGCGRGAASAVAGKWATNNIPGDWDKYSRGVAAVVAGGATSALGGGKFWNGAATAAYGYILNCLAHECLQHYVEGSGTPMQAGFSELGADNVGPDRFRQYRALVTNEDLPDGTYTVKDTAPWQTQSLNARAAYGRVILQLDGVLTVSQGEYSFAGTISARPDKYDFDQQPWGQRTNAGEISTRIGAMLPGKPFLNLFSGNKSVSSSGWLWPF